MSSDVIGGISVIQRSRHWSMAPIYRTGHILHHADGHTDDIYLAMTEGRDEPAGVAEIAGQPVWQFIRGIPRHGWMACKPSVRQFVTVEGVQRDLFHNTYDWQVQYVEMRFPEPGHNQQALQFHADDQYHTLHLLNNPALNDSERAAVFDDLRQRQIIY